VSDFLFRAFGDTEFDGVEQVSDSAFQIDAFQDQLLAWTKSVVNHELTQKGWSKAASCTRLKDCDPIAHTLNRRPTPEYLKQVGIKFPFLAIWPRDGTTEDFTLEKERIITNWSALYTLGPLDENDYQRLGGTLRIFAKLFGAMLRNRGHGEHEGGAVQFDEGQIEVSSIQLGRHAIGPAPFGQQDDGILFWASELEFQTVEVERFVEGSDPSFNGFSINADSLGHGSEFKDMAQAQSDTE